MQRDDVWFDSWGERCAAWLYRPVGDVTTPCVVMAHGFSGVREQRLDAYAERFADVGVAVLLFDYRHFGASEGKPRQLLDIKRQLADWASAISYARALPGIDPGRIALWGTSFSGGHVITTAARDKRLAAAVAQVPFVDGLMNLPRLGVAHSLRLTREGLIDAAAAAVGKEPHLIPAVGPPGSLAVMNSPDADPGFHALDPEESTWINAVAARVVLNVGTYRPIRVASKVRCPILFAIADNDVVTPTDLAHKAAKRAPHAEVVTYPGGHFDPYVGELFERVVADQCSFLGRHLLGLRPGRDAVAAAVSANGHG
jgi:dienelactone hydrolase